MFLWLLDGVALAESLIKDHVTIVLFHPLYGGLDLLILFSLSLFQSVSIFGIGERLVLLHAHVQINLAHSLKEGSVLTVVADLLVVAVHEEIDILLLCLREAIDWKLIITALEALLLGLINLELKHNRLHFKEVLV